ncbi:phosphopantetheinyl transferase [Nonomuraea sp. NPDC052116]|uniref:phosphopantetheinyl transferase n=1 Tax=Nonomuraea sp. NPDC052116 TaxID=3155665 RepID=UPI00341274A1
MGAAAGRGWSCSRVAFAGIRDPAELVRPAALESVFTRRERLRSKAGTALESWAGRLAAKRAVVGALGYDSPPGPLTEVEILPRPSPACRRSHECAHGHPPAVTLAGTLARRAARARSIQVSVSHTSDIAVAIALVTWVKDGG